MAYNSEPHSQSRRVSVFCVTCSFAPDDLFFPVCVTVAIKGTWFLFSLAICITFFALATCEDAVSPLLAVSVAGFTVLQLVVFLHKLVFLGATARGTIRDPKHRFIRELFLSGALLYCVEIAWGAFSTVTVLLDSSVSMLDCRAFRRPFYAFVVLVWLNWLELAGVALLYFSCLDRCRFFCCRALCWVKCHTRSGRNSSSEETDTDFAAGAQTVRTSHNITSPLLGSFCREHCCTCRRDGLNNSKSIAIKELSDGLDILFRDIKMHYTALDRLSGWMLVRKYHEQLLCEGREVTRELKEATLHLLRKEGVMCRDVVPDPTPLEEGSTLPETLLYYYWFSMAAYGWPVKLFLEPLSGTCQLCWGARCHCCHSAEREEREEREAMRDLEGRRLMFLKSAEVATIAGIHADCVLAGRATNKVYEQPFFVFQTTRHEPGTEKKVNEVIVSIRGTLSIKDVLTSVTASVIDAAQSLEAQNESWLKQNIKLKESCLGVKDAYIHLGLYTSAKNILKILEKDDKFRNLVESEEHPHRVVVTGHSLGAGVGAVLTLLIKQQKPRWSKGLHAYLFSTPGCVCNYELAKKAEELNLITSVVSAYDIVPRISWRSLSYLKLLVKRALENTSIKKQEVLCCGGCPNWSPTILDGSDSPVELVDKRSGRATPDLLGSLPPVRELPGVVEGDEGESGRGEVEKEVEGGGGEGATDGGRDERGREGVDEVLQEVGRRLTGIEQEEKRPRAVLKRIDSLHSTPAEEESKRVKLQRMATIFDKEKCKLGPPTFIPGRVLHLEEGKEDEEEGERETRWCGVKVLGLRCLGVRCCRHRPVIAQWKNREDFSGIVLHRDSLVDHSPRRTFAMLTTLCHTHKTCIGMSPHWNENETVGAGSVSVDLESGQEHITLEDAVNAHTVQQNGMEPCDGHTHQVVTVEVHEEQSSL